jgi:hypothetical protein
MNAPLHHDWHSWSWLVARIGRDEEVAVRRHDSGRRTGLRRTTRRPHTRTVRLQLNGAIGGLRESGIDIMPRRIERDPHVGQPLRPRIARRPNSLAAPTRPYGLSASRTRDVRPLGKPDGLRGGEETREFVELRASGWLRWTCAGRADARDDEEQKRSSNEQRSAHGSESLRWAEKAQARNTRTVLKRPHGCRVVSMTKVVCDPRSFVQPPTCHNEGKPDAESRHHPCG